MTDKNWMKDWEDEVRWATWYVPATESKCTFDPPLRHNAKAILSADLVIKRAGDVEGMAKMLCHPSIPYCSSCEKHARTLSAWLLKGKEGYDETLPVL